MSQAPWQAFPSRAMDADGLSFMFPDHRGCPPSGKGNASPSRLQNRSDITATCPGKALCLLYINPRVMRAQDFYL